MSPFQACRVSEVKNSEVFMGAKVWLTWNLVTWVGTASR
jgi:hypothetical protein